jgi:hypothetical protein
LIVDRLNDGLLEFLDEIRQYAGVRASSMEKIFSEYWIRAGFGDFLVVEQDTMGGDCKNKTSCISDPLVRALLLDTLYSLLPTAISRNIRTR